jgi:hypothetical protein
MPHIIAPVHAHFTIGRKTAAANTPFTQLIPPGPQGRQLLWAAAPNQPNWYSLGWMTRVTRIAYLSGTASHLLSVMRPKNWATTTQAMPQNSKTMNLGVDPGVYSTNYRYPLPPGAVPSLVADHPIASGDYIAYQLDDGSWQLDTVNVVAAPPPFGAFSVTTGTPNRAGATLRAGAPVFYFGVPTLLDPVTGMLDPNWSTSPPASGTAHDVFTDPVGLITALRLGDPMCFYSPNGTTAGELELISGYFGAW